MLLVNHLYTVVGGNFFIYRCFVCVAKDSKWTQRHGNRKCVFELVTMSDYESFRGLETNHRKSIPENRGDKYVSLV